MDSSPPCSSVHRILQARILEWAAISFSLSNRKRVLVNPGAILRETPLVLQRPQGQALLGTTVPQGSSASSPSGSVPGIREAKLHQPLPLLQAILVQGVGGQTRGPSPEGSRQGVPRKEGGRPHLWGRPNAPEPAAAAAGLPPWARPSRGLSWDHGWQGPLLLPADAGAGWRRCFPLCFTHNAPETTFC